VPTATLDCSKRLGGSIRLDRRIAGLTSSPRCYTRRYDRAQCADRLTGLPRHHHHNVLRRRGRRRFLGLKLDPFMKTW